MDGSAYPSLDQPISPRSLTSFVFSTGDVNSGKLLFSPLLAFSYSFLLPTSRTSIRPTLTSSGCWDPSHAWAISCLSLCWEQPSATRMALSCRGEGSGVGSGAVASCLHHPSPRRQDAGS